MDHYSSYSDLANAEKEGEDFERIFCIRDGAAVAVIAPHAGGIEPKTEDIAKDIAGDEFSFYCFRGLKKKGNRSLHITSHNFDEPECVNLVAKHRLVVAIHGCDKEGERVFLGGLDKSLIDDMALALAEAGIKAEATGHEYTGTSYRNICNLGLTKAGVQFELSLAFRNGTQVPSFIAAVRGVLFKRQNKT
jgi:phage replication-related protein YjqB (UPF0714/DUF867 family)